jgi:hypothetical protein
LEQTENGVDLGNQIVDGALVGQSLERQPWMPEASIPFPGTVFFGLSSEIAQEDLHLSKRRRLMSPDLVNAVTRAHLVESWDSVKHGPFCMSTHDRDVLGNFTHTICRACATRTQPKVCSTPGDSKRYNNTVLEYARPTISIVWSRRHWVTRTCLRGPRSQLTCLGNLK